MAVLRREVIRRPAPRLGSYHGAVLYMIDLDHFKVVNDSHGHEVGDKMLRVVARAIEQSLREGDLPVRWGGEEIVVLARGVDPVGARQFARRLLDAIAAATLSLESGPMLSLSASIGFLPYPLGNRSFLPTGEWPRLIEAADRLMYLAKQRGRARACGLQWRPNVPDEVDELSTLATLMADPEHPGTSLELITEGSDAT
jgi:diguanylate cyclase (GGDEF)-like protein